MSTETRKNKDVAGYMMLCILAEIDGKFDPREGNVIVNYIIEHFPLGGNLDNAMYEVSQTSSEDYPILFQKCAEDFYADSKPEERTEFLQFALDLVKADNQIIQSEDWMINKLYQYWDINNVDLA